MLTLKQEQTIKEILEMEDPYMFITILLKAYAQSGTEKLTDLICWSTHLGTMLADQIENKLNLSLHALRQATTDHYWIKKNFEINDNLTFITAAMSCKCLYPDGHADGGSELEHKYFNSFVNYLQIHLVEYMDWAAHMHMAEYFDLVLREAEERGNVTQLYL
jgi:hypothetical protein